MRALAFVVMLASCGGSPKPAPIPPSGGGPGSGSSAPVAKAAAPPTSAQVCKRITELQTQHCGEFANLKVGEPECIAEIDKAGENPVLAAFTGCVVQPSCEEVKNCLAAQADKAAAEPPKTMRACSARSDGTPVGMPADQFATRHGANAKRFSDATSTMAVPIEMCTINSESEWIISLACEDGSHPLRNPEAARVKPAKLGGRCGSYVDEYVVKCPEKTYDIFVDAYVCPIK